MTIENLTCPLCGGPMKSRVNRSTEQRFWGCAQFPKCKGTRNTDGEAPTRQNSQRRDDQRSELPSDRARNNDRGRWGER